MNRFSHHLTLLFIVVLLGGCTAIKAISILNKGHIVPNNQVKSTVTFTLDGHPILIKAKLNDSPKDYTFVVDTGALTLIRQDVANTLGLPEGLEVEANDSSGNSEKIHLVQLQKISVGDMKVSNCATGILNDSKFSEFFPENIDGIIGSNFFRFFSVALDFKNKQITLSKSGATLAHHHYTFQIPFTLDIKNGFAPKISCIIDDDIKTKAIIDTGTPCTSLSLALVKKTQEFKSGHAIKAIGSMSGGLAGQSKEDYILRVNRLHIGDMQLTNIPLSSHSRDNDEMLIGDDFLSKYLVTLDYPSGKMYLLSNGESLEKNPLMYGIGLKKLKGKTILSGIWPNSSAPKSGIRVGDEIIKINSIDTAKLPILELTKYFLNKEKSILDIEYKNKTGVHKLLLKKEHLLPIVNE